MTPPRRPPRSLKADFIRGAAWSIAMRWSVKLLGLASTIVLARLLTPADYGVVVMAMLVVGLAETLSDFGAEANVLRQKDPSPREINTAWTLRLLQALAVSVLIALAAPLAAEFFDEQRVAAIIWVIAVFLFVGGFRNMAVVIARKQFNYSFEYRYTISCKVVTVTATGIAAVWLRDYRALVLGICVGQLAAVSLSYLMHPHRPRWDTYNLRSQWAFGKWLLLSGLASFASRRGDEFVAGRIADPQTLGIYSVGSEIGQLPTAELGPPIMRAFLPSLATIRDDAARLRGAALQILSAINGLMWGIAAVVAGLAATLTAVLLGDQWNEAAPFVAMFALAGALRVSVSPFMGLLVLFGNTRLHARGAYIELGVFALAAGAMVPSLGVTGLAYARILASAVFLLACIRAVTVTTNISAAEVVASMWRPAVGAVMVLALLSAIPATGLAPLIDLLLQAALAIALYAGWLLTTWHAVGRPPGLEQTALDLLRRIRGAS